MALSRFVVVPANGAAQIVLPAGAFSENLYAAAGTPVNGTGSNAQGAGVYGSNGGAVFLRNQVIWADSSGAGGAGALYTAIGAGNLRAYVQGTDDVGHAALAN